MSANSLEYAKMIEVPVSTCTVNTKRGRLKSKKSTDLKKQVIDKVNASVSSDTTPVKVRAKFNMVIAELVIVCALCAVIFLTNIFVPNSGINTFLKSAFSENKQTQPIEKSYDQYQLAAPVHNFSALALNDGVMTFSGTASVYAPIDGKITAITKDSENKYILEISHTDSFKTVVSGVDIPYCQTGDTVYSTIPVGFIKESTASIYLYNNGTLLNNYTLDGGSIIWQV